MSFFKKIIEYPPCLYGPKMRCHLSDGISLFKEDTWRHQHIRVPAFTHYHKVLKDYLYNKYKDEFNQADLESDAAYQENAPIWVMWWQNPDNAPEIVRMCIDTIRKNSGNHPVMMITKDNYKDYIAVPDYIMEKVDKKEITLTHLSDIFRVCLLYEHGGLWMDSTLYLHREIPEWIFSYPFFTAKRPVEDTYYRYPKTMWNGFFMGAYMHSPYMKAMRDVLFSYWKEHGSLIEYFIIDYVIADLYDHSIAFKADLDSLCVNNSKITHLMDYINEPFDENDFNSFKGEYDFVNKLSYKRKTKEETEAGVVTYYGKMLEKFREQE